MPILFPLIVFSLVFTCIPTAYAMQPRKAYGRPSTNLSTDLSLPVLPSSYPKRKLIAPAKVQPKKTSAKTSDITPLNEKRLNEINSTISTCDDTPLHVETLRERKRTKRPAVKKISLCLMTNASTQTDTTTLLPTLEKSSKIIDSALTTTSNSSTQYKKPISYNPIIKRTPTKKKIVKKTVPIKAGTNKHFQFSTDALEFNIGLDDLNNPLHRFNAFILPNITLKNDPLLNTYPALFELFQGSFGLHSLFLSSYTWNNASLTKKKKVAQFALDMIAAQIQAHEGHPRKQAKFRRIFMHLTKIFNTNK